MPGCSSVGAGYEEQSFGDVAAYRGEQPQRAEGAEDGAVGRIVEELLKAALGSARWGRLRKADPRCGELGAAAVQEHVERRYRGCCIQNVGGVAAVPVDLAATASVERRWVIAVVGIAQSGAERIDRALNRVGALALPPGTRPAQPSPWIFSLAPVQSGQRARAP